MITSRQTLLLASSALLALTVHMIVSVSCIVRGCLSCLPVYLFYLSTFLPRPSMKASLYWSCFLFLNRSTSTCIPLITCPPVPFFYLLLLFFPFLCPATPACAPLITPVPYSYQSSALGLLSIPLVSSHGTITYIFISHLSHLYAILQDSKTIQYKCLSSE